MRYDLPPSPVLIHVRHPEFMAMEILQLIGQYYVLTRRVTMGVNGPIIPNAAPGWTVMHIQFEGGNPPLGIHCLDVFVNEIGPGFN